MTIVLDRVTDVQDQVLDVLGKAKEPVTNAVTTVVDFVLGRVSDIPVVPYAEMIPTPKEIIDNQAKFATRFVTTNKDVALSAAKAAAPLTDKLLDRKPAPRATVARKTTAKKAA